MQKKPDWDHWLQIDNLPLAHAVCLTLDISPRDNNVSRQIDKYWNERNTGRVSEGEIYKRLDIALAAKPGSFKYPNDSLSEWIDLVHRSVELRSFTAWAIKKEWTIPDRLRGIGGLPNKTAKGEPQTANRTAPKLSLPIKCDVWAKAIEATYEAMVRETGRMPDRDEVWLRMKDKPPANFPITETIDCKLPAITMVGEKSLTRDGYRKRWKQYTRAK